MNQYVGNINYYNDSRNQPAPKTTITIINDDGTWAEKELPTKWEVCDVCQGEGKHVNPSIDCNGLSAEDFYEDPDFAEDYRSGVYDVVCNCCHGRTTIKVLDRDACSEDDLAIYEEEMAEEARDAAWRAAEIAMGA